ncbi:MAG: ABC transporter permease [Candidatus Korarchaeota archaeon]|nr:ABC transporter permease [Candidatus Korarchaeota archaeon]
MPIEMAIDLMRAAVRVMTPLLLAGAGEILVERCGILNLGLEGIMLLGAFSGFIVTYYTGSPWIGVLAAILVGMAANAMFGFMTVSLALDQVVTGLALTLMASGATFYLYRAIFGWYTSPVPPHVTTVIRETPIPILSSIPVIGPVLFNQTAFTYAALLSIPLLYFVLARTRVGLEITASGEDPQVADYLGVDIVRLRYLTLLAEGALGGVAGALLSISQYNMFLDNMTAGRGFIVIAMIILGRWDPLKMTLGTLLFAFADSLQLRIQASGLLTLAWFPYQFALMLPYLLTLIALVIVGRGVKGPASLGKPYKRLR